MHKVVYLPIAEQDLLESLDYIALTLEAPQAAESLLEEFDATIHGIAQFPYAQELYKTNRPLKDEIRKIPIKGFVLYYAVYEDYIEIRRFLHGRRDRSIGIE